MRKGFAWLLLCLFSAVSLWGSGCAKRNDNPTGKKELQWKKDKEKELSGENAEKGD